MVTRVTRGEVPNFRLKIKSSLWLLVGYSLDTHWLLVAIKHFQTLIPYKSSVFIHRITLIGHTHSFQLWSGHDLYITPLKHLICSPNLF